LKRTAAFPALVVAALAPPALGADIQVPTGGSISAALAGASVGDRVLVQAGWYTENVVLKNGVQLRGGYDATFDDGTRDPSVHRTAIDGAGLGPAITSGPSVGASTIVDGFVLTGGGGSPGAGVLVIGGSPVFSGNEIAGNRRAGAAGGVYVHSGSSARFENNVIKDNSSQGSGGGMRVEHSSVVLVDNVFRDNVAPIDGGGLYVVASAVDCSGGTFLANRAGATGGGAYFQHATGSALTGNRFEQGDALYGGGLMVRDDSELTLEDNDFVDCRASISGGGVGATTFSTLSLTDNRFDGCVAAVTGGGVWGSQCAVDLLGAAASSPTSPAWFVDCAATGSFPRGVGGGAALYACTGTVREIRFTGCSADSVGGGFYLFHSQYTIERNVFESCTAPDGGGIVVHNRLESVQQECFIRNNTLWGCRGTAASAQLPGGGITLISPTTQVSRVATLAGNIIANVLQGSCLRCRPAAGGSGSSLIMGCSSLQIGAGNPAVPIPGTGSDRCVQAFSASSTNRVEDPKFCTDPPADYTLQSCSPCVDNNTCTTSLGKENRGAAPDNTECGCGGLISVDAASWGQIKAMYR
jgi:nitrous oxidase accessory protein NosD